MRNRGKSGTCPSASLCVPAGSHKEDGRVGRLIKFCTPVRSIRAVLQVGKIQLLKGADSEEQAWTSGLSWPWVCVGTMGVVGPTCWPAFLWSHIASEEQLGTSGWAYQHSAMGTSDGSCRVKGYWGRMTGTAAGALWLRALPTPGARAPRTRLRRWVEE